MMDWSGVVCITWGLLGCFYQLFGHSFWRHPFTAEHPLLNKWCNATVLQICFNEETKLSTSWMIWGWVHFQSTFIFGWTIPLRNSSLDQAISIWGQKKSKTVGFFSKVVCEILINMWTIYISNRKSYLMYKSARICSEHRQCHIYL